MHCQLEVVRDGLPSRQHLVRHDLCPQLVKLALVEWRGSTVLLPHALDLPSIHGETPWSGGHGWSRRRAVGRHGAGGMLGTPQRRGVTLRMLVHGAGWWSHPAVCAWPHAHGLHLTEACILGHHLLVHRLHRLMKLMDALRRVSPGSLRCHGVSRGWRPRAGAHLTVCRAGRGAGAGAQHGARRGAWSRGGPWARCASHRRVRSGHLPAAPSDKSLPLLAESGIVGVW